MSCSDYIARAARIAVCYPITCATTLAQLGHEPFCPRLSTTLFGSQAYMYPNIVRYISHIYQTDGFFGLYRGFPYYLIGDAIFSVVYGSPEMRLPDAELCSKEYEIYVDAVDKSQLQFPEMIKNTLWDIFLSCAGVVCSRPFIVLGSRCTAQFVGKETCYSSIFSAVSDIWKNEGISGFFAGLVPSLVFNILTVAITNSLYHSLHYIIVYVGHSPGSILKEGIFMLSTITAYRFTCPIDLTSVVMAVNPSRLKVASTLNMPKCNNWLSCLRHLKANNQTTRGSTLFFRRYHGPSNCT